MLTLFIAAAALLGIGWALGQAPLFRFLAFVLTPLAFLAMAVGWWALVVACDADRLLRPLSDALKIVIALALGPLPPLLVAGWWMRRVWRRGWPRFMQRLAARPTLLPLSGILLVQSSVLLTWLIGGNLAASWREAQAEQAWSRSGQPLATLAARYPKAPTSPAGQEVERLATALGIAVGRDLDSAGLPAKAAHDRVQGAISAYVFREARRTEGLAAAPPLEVRAWLAMSTPALGALEEQLLNAGPILWETDVDQWQPFPLAGPRDVHSALLASAYEAMSEGLTAKAQGRLEAAWRLATSLRERPSTAARLLSLLQDRNWLGALRSGAASDDSLARLDTLSDPARALGAVPLESRSFLQDARGPRTTLRGIYLESNWGLSLLSDQPQGLGGAVFRGLSGGRVEMQRAASAMEAERARAQGLFYRLVQGPLERPYLRLSAADYARAAAIEYAKARDARDPCAPMPAPSANLAERRLARWSLVGEGALSVDRLAHTAAVLRTEVELTRHVLRARELRAADPGRGWPEQLPGLDSAVCRGRRWAYAVLPDGTASVRLEASPFAEHEATVAFRMSER
jgi:hypothetical protein